MFGLHGSSAFPINNRIAGSDIFNARRGGQGGRLGVEPPAGRGFEGLILIRGARVISVDYAARLLGRALGCPDPRHELVETWGGPEIDHLGEHVGDVRLRIDAVQLAGFDERRNAGHFSTH